MNQDAEDQGEFTMVARFLNPMDAYVVRACLEGNGIPAIMADQHMVLMDNLLNIAVGGIRVLVPANRVAEAMETIAAFNRGDLALREGEDVEDPH